MDVCVCIFIVLLLVIMLSVGLIIGACRENPEAIRLAGAAWPTDICKCFGVITLFWWVEQLPGNICVICIKVGYARFSMPWHQKGGDYSPEFYHGGIGDRYAAATIRGCYTWVFNGLLPLVPETARGHVNANDVRVGIAGIAEVALRSCILYFVHNIHGVPLGRIHYGSDSNTMYPTSIYSGVWPSPKGGSGEFFVVQVMCGSAEYNAVINAINDAVHFMDNGIGNDTATSHPVQRFFRTWPPVVTNPERLAHIRSETQNWLQQQEVYTCMATTVYNKCMYIHDRINCMTVPDCGCAKYDHN